VEDRKLTETEIMFGALDRIVREEMKKKPSKRDEALIDECIAEMAKLKNVRAGYTEEEIAVIVEQLQEKAAEKSRGTSGKPKRVRRLAAVICAACLIMGCGIACVAWNPFSAVKEWVLKIAEVSDNRTVQAGDISYFSYNNTAEYDDIKELLKQENLNIYYPAVLPDDLYITRVDNVVNDNYKYVKIYFNESRVEFTIQYDTQLYLNIPEYEMIKTDYTSFYISFQNDKYLARGYIDSNLYSIECISYEDIITIIKNLKEG